MNIYNTSNVTINSTNPSLTKITTSFHTQSQIDEPWSFWLRVFLAVTLMTCIVIGNSMVLYCLLTIRELQTVTGIFLTNLAVTDLGVGVVTFPLALVSTTMKELLHQRWFCVVQGMAVVLFVIASILTLGVLSLVKYITVGYSMVRRFTKKHARYAISSIWAISIIFTVAPAFGISKYGHRAGSHQCAPYDNSVSGSTYAIIVGLIGFLLPSITMLYCYCKLYVLTHSYVRRRRVHDVAHPTRMQQSLSSAESHMIHTLIIMVFVFFICWMPSVILYFLSFADIVVSTTIDTICVFCVFGNSAVNPILYTMRQKDFQRGFRQITRRCFSFHVHRP